MSIVEVYLWGVLAGIRIERENQLINQSVDKAINQNLKSQ